MEPKDHKKGVLRAHEGAPEKLSPQSTITAVKARRVRREYLADENFMRAFGSNGSDADDSIRGLTSDELHS